MISIGNRKQRGLFSPIMIRWLTAVATAGACLLSFGGTSEREFSFNPDPTLELLKANFRGGASGTAVTYNLYADGRLVIQRSDYSGENIFESYETVLSYEEVTALVRQIVDDGLMEFDAKKVQRDMGESAKLYIVHDGSTMTLDIRLPSYRGLGQETASPAEMTIVFASPTAVASRFPMVREVQGLAEIARKLRGFKKIAQEKKDEK